MPGVPALGGLGAVPALPNLSGMQLPTVNPAAGLSQMFMGTQLQNTFGLAAQAAQQQLQDQQRTSAMTRLSALAGVASASPAVAATPNFSNSVKQAWQQAGLGTTPPLNPDGTIDVNGLAGVRDPRQVEALALAAYNTAKTTDLIPAQVNRYNALAGLDAIKTNWLPRIYGSSIQLKDAQTKLDNIRTMLMPGQVHSKEQLEQAEMTLADMRASVVQSLAMSTEEKNAAIANFDNISAAVKKELEPFQAQALSAHAKYYGAAGDLAAAKTTQVRQEVTSAIALDELARKGDTKLGVYMKPADFFKYTDSIGKQIDSLRSKRDTIIAALHNTTTPPTQAEAGNLEAELNNINNDYTHLTHLQAQLWHRAGNYTHPYTGTKPLDPKALQTKLGAQHLHESEIPAPGGGKYFFSDDGTPYLADPKSKKYIQVGPTPQNFSQPSQDTNAPQNPDGTTTDPNATNTTDPLDNENPDDTDTSP